MALARLILRNMPQRPTSSLLVSGRERSLFAESRRFMSAKASDNDVKTSTQTNEEVCVGEGTHKKKLGKRSGGSLFNRRRRDLDFAPPLWEIFPSGLGNALMQATENMNKLFNTMNISSPYDLPLPLAHVKTEDKSYLLHYEMPGLSKDDVKITVDDDGVLKMTGERKQEKNKEGNSDDGNQDWSSRIYYNASITLPDDAKFDEIKAELKDGLLTITVPRIENPNKGVKEVQVY